MMTGRTAHLIAGLALVSSLSFGPRSASFADMTVTCEVTIGSSKSTFIETTYWTKSKMRVDKLGGSISITDLESKTTTVFRLRRKTYTQRSFEEMKKEQRRLPGKVKEMKLSVQETGEKKIIDGYPCEKLLVKYGPADPTEMTVWITGKIAIDPAVSEFNKKYRELTKDIPLLNVQGQMWAEFERRKAHPYLQTTESPALFVATQRIESKVKKVSYEKIEPSVFAIPAGYKRRILRGSSARGLKGAEGDEVSIGCPRRGMKTQSTGQNAR